MNIALYLILLGGLLLFLYFLQQNIIKSFSRISLLLFGTNKAGVYLYFLFFLPGVVFHELAHLFTASILGVPTGQLTVFPQREKEGWTLGKVSSAETDILRSSLIGLAPMFVGVTSIIIIGTFVFGIRTPIDFSLLISKIWTDRPLWQNIILFYLILTFSNTMFLSKEDRMTIWVLPSILIIIFIAAWIIWGQELISVIQKETELVTMIIRPLATSFSLTCLVDLVFFLFLYFITKVIRRFKNTPQFIAGMN
ncbi:MAG: hypothetical protein V1858_04145 [Candidatus Gottesmanbacteria bacterium]